MPAAVRRPDPTMPPQSTGSGEGTGGRGPKALVLYDSRYGNTKRVAEALARGLGGGGVLTVDCANIRDFPVERIGEYDFIAVGGPTEGLSASKPMKEFLHRLEAFDLGGRAGFTFDTRFDFPLAGSAARAIQHRLERLGVTILRPRSSAIVRGMTAEESRRQAVSSVPAFPRKMETGIPAGLPEPGTRTGEVGRVLLLPGMEAEFERIGTELRPLLLSRTVAPRAAAIV